MHSQNQRFLRIQMKQKKDADSFKVREEAKFQSNWEFTAPAESLEHIIKVNDFQKNLVQKDNNHRLEAVDKKNQFVANQKSTDQAVHNERINADLVEMQNEKEELRTLKLKMQEVNK